MNVTLTLGGVFNSLFKRLGDILSKELAGWAVAGMLSPFNVNNVPLPDGWKRSQIKRLSIHGKFSRNYRMAGEGSFEDAAFGWLSRQQIPGDKSSLVNLQSTAQASAVVSIGAGAVKTKLLEAIEQSILAGDSAEDWQKRAKGIINGTRAKIETIGRTYTHRAYHEGFKQTVNDPVLKHVFPYRQYLATKDTRVRATHFAMDKKIAYVGSPLQVEMERLHSEWGCRCTIVALTREQAVKAGIDDDTGYVPYEPPSQEEKPDLAESTEPYGPFEMFGPPKPIDWELKPVAVPTVVTAQVPAPQPGSERLAVPLPAPTKVWKPEAAKAKTAYSLKDGKDIDKTWKPNPNKYQASYGGVVLKTGPDGQIHVLLRKPSNNYDGYHWTFPKGKQADGTKEHPDAISTALAEVAEETGHKCKPIGHLKGTFKSSGSTTNNFFVMKSVGHDPALMDAETEKTKWVPIADAAELIKRTTNGPGRKRDLEILRSLNKWIDGQAEQKVKSVTPPAKKPALGWPTNPLDLPVIQRLGGSTGATLRQDQEGNKYVVKTGANPGHVKEEHAADSAYAAAGVNVPAGKLAIVNGTPVKATRYLEGGVTLSEYERTATAAEVAKVKKQLQKDFALDCILGNRDVIGLSKDNILIAGGKAYRIDNGSSFRYRAQGAVKSLSEYGPNVLEFDGLRSASINSSAASVFGSMTDKDLLSSIDKALKKQAKVMSFVPDPIKAIVEQRFEWMKTKRAEIAAKLAPVQKVAPAPTGGGKLKTVTLGCKGISSENVPAVFSQDMTKSRIVKNSSDRSKKLVADLSLAGLPMTRDEREQISDYGGGGYASTNQQFRHWANGGHEPSQNCKDMVKAIHDVIDKSKPFPGDKIPTFRGWASNKVPYDTIKQAGATDHKDFAKKFIDQFEGALKDGKLVQMAGIQSSSINSRVAGSFASLSSSSAESIVFEFSNKTGVYISGLHRASKVSLPFGEGEYEFLQKHNTQYRVVAVLRDVPANVWHAEASHGNTKPITVIQLEEVPQDPTAKAVQLSLEN